MSIIIKLIDEQDLLYVVSKQLGLVLLVLHIILLKLLRNNTKKTSFFLQAQYNCHIYISNSLRNMLGRGERARKPQLCDTVTGSGSIMTPYIV